MAHGKSLELRYITRPAPEYIHKNEDYNRAQRRHTPRYDANGGAIKSFFIPKEHQRDTDNIPYRKPKE